jgi:hypothetical protein
MTYLRYLMMTIPEAPSPDWQVVTPPPDDPPDPDPVFAAADKVSPESLPSVPPPVPPVPTPAERDDPPPPPP